MLKIEVVEDDIVHNGLLPAPVRSMPVEIVDCEAVGRWSQEQLTLGDDGNQLFIRIDPPYHEEDKGIYFVRLYLRHHLDKRDFGHSRFDFHLVGSTFGVSRFETVLLSFWPGSVVGGSIDNDRTTEVAAVSLPFSEQ